MLPIHDLKQKIEPTALVIFGATGELSSTRLLPSLHHMFAEKLLPDKFWIIGFSRTQFSRRQFRNRVKSFVLKADVQFLKKIYYCPGNFGEPRDFRRLASELVRLESARHSCANRLFYFATLPSHYETICRELSQSGLLIGCARHHRTTRVIVEKPFGHDLKSAQKLDATLQKYFREDQIYRIDHYLGKETVQNLLTVRFANSIFEPLWNHNYIDHVQISALEKVGIGNRGAYYEQAGALRDFAQNHLIQLLSLIAMEPPNDLSADSIRDERVKVIRAVRRPSPNELKTGLAVGQYRGYQAEKDVSRRSRTETYAALKLFIDNSRWASVPFYLRTGKGLRTKIAEISVHFKPTAANLFDDHAISANVLRFKIQPNEGLFLDIVAKYPGFGLRLHPVTMELGYHTAFQGEIPEAYERLLLDFMQGDQRLFARSDEIEHSWRYIDVIEQHLAKNKKNIPSYADGSWGPKQGEALIKKDKREWLIK